METKGVIGKNIDHGVKIYADLKSRENFSGELLPCQHIQTLQVTKP